jgi:hypothetical protein
MFLDHFYIVLVIRCTTHLCLNLHDFEQRYLGQIKLGGGLSANLYGSSKKVCSGHLVN